jgi:zinc protease
LLGVCLMAPGLARSAGKDSGFPRPEIREWSLPNGLGVIFAQVRRAPVVSVQVWYHAGSKDERRDRRGSAHMFEHIMFKGTRHVPPEEHARHIDRVGGDVNAFTTEDMTAYHDTVPRQYLDFAVQLEAERMQHLLFLEETIATEREVVKEEIRQRENNPIMKAFVRFRELMFTRHPYAWDAGGRIEDLDLTTPADLEAFYRTYYQPNNAYLIVVGDVEEAEVRASAERWFGAIPRAAEPPRPAREAEEPPQTELRRARSDPGQVGVIIGGFKIPAARSEDMIPLKVLASILSEGESSRLYRRVVRQDKVGVYAGMYLQEMEDPGVLMVFGVHLAPDQAPALEAALLSEVDRLCRATVSPAELAKAKNQLAAGLVNSLGEVSGIAFQIGSARIQRGDARAWLTDYDRILQVSAADVQRVAKKYLRPETLTLVDVPPGGGPGAGGGR